MKRIATRFCLAAAAVSLGTVTAFAQGSKPAHANGLLYKISKKGVERPSYLFGTFHVICPEDMLPMDKLKGFLGQTDQLVMEVDMDDPSELMTMGMSMMIPDGKTLKDFLTTEQYAKVDQMFTNILGQSVDRFKSVKPSLLQVMIVANPKVLGCMAPSSYDMELMQTAVAGKKPIAGLETLSFQAQMMAVKPMKDQAKELYEMAENPQKSADELKLLLKIYKSQDPEQLYKTSDRLATDKAFQARLLDERNVAWIPKIETAVKEKPSFIAVGGGHLGGKKGVVNLLRARGYKVEPIRL
ncbi:MAG: TraB/GumN family protein [Pyrinomonadaceae bacterium]